jgi:hypothetical protein
MNTKFWEDSWIGNVPLAQQYPSLYNIMENRLGRAPLNITFWRTLTRDKWHQWLELVQRIMHVQLTNEKRCSCLGLSGVGRIHY